MIGRLVFCVIACCAAVPVVASERNVAAPDVPLLAVSVDFPGYDGVLTVGGDIAVRLRGAPLPAVTLAAFENRGLPDFGLVPMDALAGDPLVVVSPYSVVELRSLRAWRVSDRLAPVTANASGLYAVRDLLAENRKPRFFRRRALSTTLVLRIDGNDETPILSIGGGGIPAALWGAMPQ